MEQAANPHRSEWRRTRTNPKSGTKRNRTRGGAYLLDLGEAELQGGVDPREDLVAPDEVSAVHHADVGRRHRRPLARPRGASGLGWRSAGLGENGRILRFRIGRRPGPGDKWWSRRERLRCLDKSALGWNREGSDLDGGRELGVRMDGEVLLTVGRGARCVGGLVIQMGEGCCGGQPSPE
jgi:hypothetical protein